MAKATCPPVGTCSTRPMDPDKSSPLRWPRSLRCARSPTWSSTTAAESRPAARTSKSPLFAHQTDAICKDDESNVGTGAIDTGESQVAARDLDHTNADVQAAIKTYLADLKNLGFSGWRYDEVRGYAGAFVGVYNDDSRPHLSVGEFWDGDRQNVVNWIDSTRGKSMAFDFPTRALLKAAIGTGSSGCSRRSTESPPESLAGGRP